MIDECDVRWPRARVVNEPHPNPSWPLRGERRCSGRASVWGGGCHSLGFIIHVSPRRSRPADHRALQRVGGKLKNPVVGAAQVVLA